MQKTKRRWLSKQFCRAKETRARETTVGDSNYKKILENAK
jgi:hypothetical protein